MHAFRFHADIRVRFAETDAQGVAHNSNYLVWFEVARVGYLDEFTGGYKTLQDQGLESLVLESHVRYRRPAKFDDRLEIHTRIGGFQESVEALSRAQAAGVSATGEVTPHHLCLTDEAVRSLDANLKMNPPLRAAEDRAALVAGLRNGTIGCVATDHAPHARHEKAVPFEEAPFGVTGLETAFAALNTYLVRPGLLTLETLLERMSAGPARAFGLDRPRLAVGAPANLVLVDTEAAWRVTEDGFRSRSANSWLLGQTLKGKVRLTVAAGRVVFEA